MPVSHTHTLLSAHPLTNTHPLPHTHELHLPFAVIILAAIYLLSMFRLSTDCQTAHRPPPSDTPPTRQPASFFLALCYHFHFKMSLSWQRLLLLERSAPASFSGSASASSSSSSSSSLAFGRVSYAWLFWSFFWCWPKATRRNDAPAAGTLALPLPCSALPCLVAVSSCFKTFRGLWPLYKCFCNGFLQSKLFRLCSFSFSLLLSLTLCLARTAWPASDCECVTFVQGRSVGCEGGRKYIKMQTQLILRGLN